PQLISADVARRNVTWPGCLLKDRSRGGCPHAPIPRSRLRQPVATTALREPLALSTPPLEFLLPQRGNEFAKYGRQSSTIYVTDLSSNRPGRLGQSPLPCSSPSGWK